MSELRYDNQIFVITGAGSGLGKAYATFFASRGASVVVNDLGGSFKGEGCNSKIADLVVDEIKAAGGKAVANYDSVENGEKIIQTAIKSFGRIDVLINNAGILRDVSFKNMSHTDWDLVMAVHLRGTYKCTKAAWTHFKRQSYGRIINTSSGSGLFGSFGQTNYSAAKLAIVGFTETLALEGADDNIMVNAIAPGAGSRMTATVLPPDIQDNMHPELVVPIVAILVHHSNTKQTGSIFEAAAGHFSKIRWERSEGALIRHDDIYAPDAVLKIWDKIVGLSQNAKHSLHTTDSTSNFKETMALSRNVESEQFDFRGKVALIMGSGTGLGRVYSHLFAKLGARVVVNNIINADTVVEEIKSLGGEATGINISSENIEGAIKACIETYGQIDIIVNNAETSRAMPFSDITHELWEAGIAIRLRGAYRIIKAAWPYMLKQKYGRIVNVVSTAGIYGKSGHANYAAAAAGILGFSRALAREGIKYNIHVNSVAISTGTRMRKDARSNHVIQDLNPEYVAPLVVALCSDRAPTQTGGLYESGAGWIVKTRWQRTRGADFPLDKKLTPEDVIKVFHKIIDFDDGRADNPETPQDGSKYTTANLQNFLKEKKQQSAVSLQANRAILSKIAAAKEISGAPSTYKYTDLEVILYNIAIGFKHTDLAFTYENDPNFQVLPTFGVIPTLACKAPYKYTDIVSNFNPKMLLHSEQYLEILQYPIPTKATLTTKINLIEVIDKGNAALVRRGATTKDMSTGRPFFYEESVVYIRNSGGFGGPRKSLDRGAITAPNYPPNRTPDFIREEATHANQATLFRLLGDRNPLHVDPAVSTAAGFKVPILHDLATFGISGKHVFMEYGPYKNIKVRFAGTVLPGQTLVTEMWKEGTDRVVYQVRVKETGKLCISNAAVELLQGMRASL